MTLEKGREGGKEGGAMTTLDRSGSVFLGFFEREEKWQVGGDTLNINVIHSHHWHILPPSLPQILPRE